MNLRKNISCRYNTGFVVNSDFFLNSRAMMNYFQFQSVSFFLTHDSFKIVYTYTYNFSELGFMFLLILYDVVSVFMELTHNACFREKFLFFYFYLHCACNFACK